jgi:hypothetical protein
MPDKQAPAGAADLKIVAQNRNESLNVWRKNH